MSTIATNSIVIPIVLHPKPRWNRQMMHIPYKMKQHMASALEERCWLTMSDSNFGRHPWTYLEKISDSTWVVNVRYK